MDKNTLLSEHFTFGQLVATQNRKYIEQNYDLGLNYVDNLTRLATELLEPIWELIGPFSVTSAFRCSALNKAIGGAPGSQHCTGEAADIIHGYTKLDQVWNGIAVSTIPYGQLIYEFGSWVHVSLPTASKQGQKLMASLIEGKTVYAQINHI